MQLRIGLLRQASPGVGARIENSAAIGQGTVDGRVLRGTVNVEPYPVGVVAKRLRSTRLLNLIVSLDPKVVADALGMNAGGLVSYLADSVDAGRLADLG